MAIVHDMTRPVAAPWPRSWAHVANIAIVSAMFIGSWLVFDRLPDRIPLHFSFNGAPDGWGERSLASWLGLPFVTLAVTTITYVAAWFVGRRPKSINLPDKKRYDKLSPESQFEVIHLAQRFVFWLTVGINLVMAAVHAGSFLVATGQSAALPGWSRLMLLALVVSSPLSTVVIVLRTNSLITRLTK